MPTNYIPHKLAARLAMAAATLLMGTTVLTANNEDGSVDFNRDIRPILANHCYHCHGPDANTRQADLRLDTQTGIAEQREPPLIVQHRPAASELIHRITTSDSDVQMPPAESNRELTAAQVQLLTRWIQQGAEYSVAAVPGQAHSP